MIQAEKLTKRYGEVTAVENVSFNIDQGDICGFLGPNGAGKTTTMRILTGFIPPSEGRATVAGFDVFTDALEVKKRVGYLPESTPLYAEMRVAEYLDFVAALKGFRGAIKRRKVADVMEVTRITERQRSLIGSLSKGYRQRVGLAQALVSDPEVLILDEPTIGLDPQQIMDIRALIKDLSGKRTVILSSHLLPEVQMICSRVLIINNGKLVAADTLEGLSMKMGKRISARIEGPADEIRLAVERLEGVARVSSQPLRSEAGASSGVVKCDIFLREGANPRKEILRLVVEKNWDLIELSGASMSLEEVYIKLISEQEGGEGGGEA